MAQLSVAIALVSAVSLAGIGGGLSLLANDRFMRGMPHKWLFATSIILFAIAVLCSFAAVVSRLLDFRLTARLVRRKQHPEYTRSLKLFGSDEAAYRRATWRLFWASCCCFVIAGVLFIVSVGAHYVHRG